MSRAVPTIAGTRDHLHASEEDKLFTKLDKFDERLTTPKPDLYYGARPSQIDQRVRTDLGRYIVPSSDTTLPAAPNFFLEAKSRSGRQDVVYRQAMYDGAVGARAMSELQHYGKPTMEYDGNAYSGAATYHPTSGFLQLYSTHPRQSSSGRTEYYSTELGAHAMKSDVESFRRGATAYRNYRDYSREQRDQFIANANSIAREPPDAAMRSNGLGGRTGPSTRHSPNSDTSADELALDFNAGPVSYTPPRKRVARNAAGPAQVRSSTNASASGMPGPSRRGRVTGRRTRRDEEDDDTDEE